MLDRLPRLWRHLIIQLLAGLLGWAAADLVPWLDQHGGLVAIAGALLGQILLVLTPLVRGYGVEQDAVGQAFASTGVHRRGDAGRAGVLWVIGTALALAASVLFLLLALASAPPADARPRLEHVGITTRPTDCRGLLTVGFGLEQLWHGAWEFVQDDGRAVVELHHLGAAAGPGGHWEAYPARTSSGGEGHLRVDVRGLPTWDAVRVVHAGVASSQRPVEACVS